MWHDEVEWILFRRPISAETARNFGFLLLDKGAATINVKANLIIL